MAFHFVCGDHNKGKEEKPKSSSVHFYQPWIVNEYGYSTNITARLQEVEATTSLLFQKFLESDTVDVSFILYLDNSNDNFLVLALELHSQILLQSTV